MTNPLSLTGNTIYLGLGIIAPHEGIRWIKALTSILSFCLGSFFFARFHRALGIATGLASVLLGAFLFYQIGFVDGLFTDNPDVGVLARAAYLS